MKIPKKFFPVVFAFFLTLIMVFIVTGVGTAMNVGFPPDFLALWMKAWGAAWMVAFPSAIFVAPLARRLTERVLG
jgi:cytochrome c biogenesis protein CcdA